MKQSLTPRINLDFSSFTKTNNGGNQKIMKVTEQRLRDLKAKLT